MPTKESFEAKYGEALARGSLVHPRISGPPMSQELYGLHEGAAGSSYEAIGPQAESRFSDYANCFRFLIHNAWYHCS